MSIEGDIANQVKAILSGQTYALAITPIVLARVDIDAPTSRQCIVLPAGFQSERADRGTGRLRTYYTDIFLTERIDGNPNSEAGFAWFDARYGLLEQIEATDFSTVTAATFEESQVVHLFYEGAEADDDALFLQILRLEFSDP